MSYGDGLPGGKVRVEGYEFVDEDGEVFEPWGNQTALADVGGERMNLWSDSDFRVSLQKQRRRGANAIRTHITYARFMETLFDPHEYALYRLRRCMQIAAEERIRVVITCNSFWGERNDWPDDWENASEANKWKSCAMHCETVAEAVRGLPAVLAIDLVNEPISGAPGSWHYGNVSGNWFQLMLWQTLDGKTLATRVAEWLEVVGGAVRRADPEQLITVGLLPVFDNFSAAFATSPYIDYVSVHEYLGSTAQVTAAMTRANQFTALSGKPLLWEEFGLSGSLTEGEKKRAIIEAKNYGVTGFFNGGGGLSWEEASQITDTYKDNVRYFAHRPATYPGAPKERVVWLPPRESFGAKSEWVVSGTTDPAWKVLQGQGEIPDGEPLLPKANPNVIVPSNPVDLSRYVTHDLDAGIEVQVVEFQYPPTINLPVKRLEGWIWYQADVGAYVDWLITEPDPAGPGIADAYRTSSLGLSILNLYSDGWAFTTHHGSVVTPNISDQQIALSSVQMWFRTQGGDVAPVRLFLARLKVVYDASELY